MDPAKLAAPESGPPASGPQDSIRDTHPPWGACQAQESEAP